jgi:predicted transcriptional regulator
MKKEKETEKKRKGKGRPRVPYTTTTIAFRVRTEFVEDVKKLVKDYVAQRIKKVI